MTTPSRHSAAWRQVDPARAALLGDARLQFHHATQLATALGISYLPPQADDSHTNLEWLSDLRALASRPVNAAKTIRLAVSPHPLALLALDGANATIATLPLHGHTIDSAVRWIRTQLEAAGMEPDRYTLERHYTIPPHPVVDHLPFDTTRDEDFAELAAWFANANLLLTEIVSERPNASEIRCWPHHFDIATLISVAPKQTIGVGMEPGDVYYAEPYLYVNMTPSPQQNVARPPLAGGGSWHTKEWTGAVLTGSHLAYSNQRAQCEAFLRSMLKG